MPLRMGLREAPAGCGVEMRPAEARQAVGTVWATISVTQMSDEEGLDQGDGGGHRGGQVQEQVNQWESGPCKVTAQNLTSFYFSSSRKSSLRPCERKR